MAKRQAVEDEDYDRAKMLKVRRDSSSTHLRTPRSEMQILPAWCVPCNPARCVTNLRSRFFHYFPGRWRRILFGYRSPPTRTLSSAPSWKKQACRYSMTTTTACGRGMVEFLVASAQVNAFEGLRFPAPPVPTPTFSETVVAVLSVGWIRQRQWIEFQPAVLFMEDPTKPKLR